MRLCGAVSPRSQSSLIPGSLTRGARWRLPACGLPASSVTSGPQSPQHRGPRSRVLPHARWAHEQLPFPPRPRPGACRPYRGKKRNRPRPRRTSHQAFLRHDRERRPRARVPRHCAQPPPLPAPGRDARNEPRGRPAPASIPWPSVPQPSTDCAYATRRSDRRSAGCAPGHAGPPPSSCPQVLSPPSPCPQATPPTTFTTDTTVDSALSDHLRCAEVNP